MALVELATFEDVAARPGGASLDQEAVEAKITDASAMLLSMMGSRYDDTDDVQAAVLTAVCCSMVIRALTSYSTDVGFGVSQHSMTAGSFNESFSYSNPTGDLYVTSQEMKALGIKKSRIGTIGLSIRPNFRLRSTIDPEDS